MKLLIPIFVARNVVLEHLFNARIEAGVTTRAGESTSEPERRMRRRIVAGVTRKVRKGDWAPQTEHASQIRQTENESPLPGPGMPLSKIKTELLLRIKRASGSSLGIPGRPQDLHLIGLVNTDFWQVEL